MFLDHIYFCYLHAYDSLSFIRYNDQLTIYIMFGLTIEQNTQL